MQRRLAAHALFFPAAAAYATALVPLSTLGMTGVVRMPAALSTPSAHAHEMLIGYALAVVAGYQLPALPAPRLLLLFGLWMLGRVWFLAAPGAGLATALNGAFAVAVALQVAPRLMRSAKKLRNQALPVLLVAVCAAALAYEVARRMAATAHSILVSMVLALAALMLFMGGRILAPMAAGAFYRRGRSLGPRVQPRIEAALMVTAAAAAVTAAMPALDAATRVACIAAGALALVRLLRWRPWGCAGDDEVLRFAAGYAWLAAGLIAIGSTHPGSMRIAAVHLITVGALGTLTLNVMGRLALARAGRNGAPAPALNAATVLLGAATALRFASAPWPAQSAPLLLAAAGCWSAAFAMLTVLLVRTAAARRARA